MHSLALIRKLTVATREEIAKFLNKNLVNKPNMLKNHRFYTLLQKLWNKMSYRHSSSTSEGRVNSKQNENTVSLATKQ